MSDKLITILAVLSAGGFIFNYFLLIICSCAWLTWEVWGPELKNIWECFKAVLDTY